MEREREAQRRWRFQASENLRSLSLVPSANEDSEPDVAVMMGDGAVPRRADSGPESIIFLALVLLFSGPDGVGAVIILRMPILRKVIGVSRSS